MKTRIVQTKFWTDAYIMSLNTKQKLMFLYLITNENVNISGVYEIADKTIQFYLGITSKESMEYRSKFEKDGKFIFLDDWVKIVNVEKYNNYRFSDRNEKAYQKELSYIPKHILDYFNITHTEVLKEKEYKKNHGQYVHRIIAERQLGRPLRKDEVVHHIDSNSENNNPDNLAVMTKELHIKLHNKEIDMNDTNIILVSQGYDTSYKSKTINKKSENTSLESLRTFLNYFNQVFSTRYTSTDALLPNFEYWNKQYTLDDLKKATDYAKRDMYWKDKMTPEILLRQKNPRGEQVDRIGQLINSREALKVTNRSLIDEIEQYGTQK